LKNPKARIATGSISCHEDAFWRRQEGKRCPSAWILLTAISSSEFFLRYFHFSYICFSFTEMRTSKAPQK
jgi:hypothetical protein